MEIYWVEKLPQALQVASLFIVFFILAVFGQRKTWLSTEVIMAAAMGVGFGVFPRYLLNFQVYFYAYLSTTVNIVYSVTKK